MTAFSQINIVTVCDKKCSIFKDQMNIDGVASDFGFEGDSQNLIFLLTILFYMTRTYLKALEQPKQKSELPGNKVENKVLSRSDQ